MSLLKSFWYQKEWKHNFFYEFSSYAPYDGGGSDIWKGNVYMFRLLIDKITTSLSETKVT